MREGSAPDTETPTLPQIGFGRPGFFVISVQCSPPSVDLNRPLPGPPLDSECGVRETSQRPASSTSGLFGSIDTSTAPVLSSRNIILRHVLPPSTVLKPPRSGFGAYGSPSAATYRTSEFQGWTRILATVRVFSRPTCVHVFPASVDL